MRFTCRSVRVQAVRGASVAAVLAAAAPAVGQGYLDYKNRASIGLPGTVRDFQPAFSGGHIDFGFSMVELPGRYVEIAEDILDADRKPVFRSQGWLVTSDWLDSTSQLIMPPRTYINEWPGDVAGSQSSMLTGAVQDAASFADWFRDSAWSTTAGGTMTMTLGWDAGNSVYTFDGTLDDLTGSTDHTYTFKAGTTFVYEAGKNWYLEVETDADAWLYIDGRLVLDMGSGSEGTICAGVATTGSISLQNTALIDVDPGSRGRVSTNSTAAGAIKLLNSAQIDAGVRVGPGGNPASGVQGAGGVNGSIDTLASPIAIPAIPPPVGLPPKIVKREYDGNSTYTINANLWCDEFYIKNQATLQVQGNIIIRADKVFSCDNNTTIELMPGATLTVYAYDKIEIQNYADVNVNTADPGRMTIYNMGSTTMVIQNNTQIYTNIVSPSAGLYIGNSGHLHGAYMGKSLAMQDSGRFTIDAPPVCSGIFAAAATHGNPAPAAAQRIDLDRLGWLQDRGTHRIDFFFANRRDEASTFRITTDAWTLRLANFQSTSKVD